MKGLTSIESKLRTLDAVAVEKQRGECVSVVRYDKNGVTHWPDNCNPAGVLLVPRQLLPDEWEAQGHAWLEKSHL